MIGPALINRDGERIELEWHRLKPDKEVRIRGWSDPLDAWAQHQLAQGATLGPELVDGAGFDRRRIRLAEVPVDLAALSAEAAELGLLGDDVADFVAHHLAVRPVNRALGVEAEWTAGDIQFARNEALKVLAAYDHPSVEEGVRTICTWIGEDLCWASWPGRTPFAALEDDAIRVVVGGRRTFDLRRSYDGLPLRSKDPREETLWSDDSPLRWAIEVARLTGRLERAVAAGASTAVMDAAFSLGTFLTDNSYRRLYQRDLVRGQESDPAKGGRARGAQRRQAADLKWRAEGLAIAKALQTRTPSISQARLAEEIEERLADPPQREAIEKQIRKWMRERDLNPSPGMRGSVPRT